MSADSMQGEIFKPASSCKALQAEAYRQRDKAVGSLSRQ